MSTILLSINQNLTEFMLAGGTIELYQLPWDPKPMKNEGFKP